MEDLIIIGAGPAGLTAAIYGARSGLKTLILEANTPGGQVVSTNRVENYPGFPQGIGGSELMLNFLDQAKRWGAVLRREKVTKLLVQEESHQVVTNQGTYTAKAVIIATGARARLLGVPGENQWTGRGLSYCTDCQAAPPKGKKVLVVGGGEAAVEGALSLAQQASEVVLIHRREQLRVPEILEQRAQAEPKLRFIWNSVVNQIKGDSQVEAVGLQCVKTKAETLEKTEGLFVYIGKIPNTAFLEGCVPLDDKGYVVTNAWMATELPGIYAVGDVRKKAFRQISTAVGDGTEGAMAAQHYIANL